MILKNRSACRKLKHIHRNTVLKSGQCFKLEDMIIAVPVQPLNDVLIGTPYFLSSGNTVILPRKQLWTSKYLDNLMSTDSQKKK